jgi:hypothetical protein
VTSALVWAGKQQGRSNRYVVIPVVRGFAFLLLSPCGAEEEFKLVS